MGRIGARRAGRVSHVLAYFPGDLLAGDGAASSRDLYTAAAWEAGAGHPGGVWSLPGPADLEREALSAWVGDRLRRPVELMPGTYEVRTEAEARRCTLFEVAAAAPSGGTSTAAHRVCRYGADRS